MDSDVIVGRLVVREAEGAPRANASPINALPLLLADSLSLVKLGNPKDDALVLVRGHLGACRESFAIGRHEDAGDEFGMDKRHDTFTLLTLGHGNIVPEFFQTAPGLSPLAPGEFAIRGFLLSKVLVHGVNSLFHGEDVKLSAW